MKPSHPKKYFLEKAHKTTSKNYQKACTFTKVCPVILNFAAYFIEIGKLIPESIHKGKGFRKDKIISKKKKVGGVTLPGFKTQ